MIYLGREDDEDILLAASFVSGSTQFAPGNYISVAVARIHSSFSWNERDDR